MESRNEDIKFEGIVEKKETMLERPNIVETIVETITEEKLEYELEVNTLTMENVLQNIYNYYMIHKLNKEDIDTIFDKMIKDGYSFIEVPRDTRDELKYELNIRVGEDKEEVQTGS